MSDNAATIEPLEPRALLSDYFVSASTGADSNGGAADAPWQTLQRAARAVAPGDVVTVRAGHYGGFIMGWDFRQDGTAAAPITFRAEQGAIIDRRAPKTPDGINLENVSHVIIEGFAVQPAVDQDWWRAGIRSGGGGTGNVIRDNVVQMRAGDKFGVFSSFTTDLRVENNDVSGTRDSGIYTSNSAVRPIIRGNVVHDTDGNGIHFNGDASQHGGSGVIIGAVVENNTITSAGGRIGGGAINMDGVQHSRIIGNTLRDNRGKGITLYRIDASAPAKDNLVANNHVEMPANSRGDALTIKNASTGNTVRGNFLASANHARGGLNIEPDCIDGLKSDDNILIGGITTDDGVSRLTLAQWQRKTTQDLHSRDTRSQPATQKSQISSGSFRVERILAVLAVGALIVMGSIFGLARRRGLGRWLISYIRQRWQRRGIVTDQPIHVLLCIADHYEPRHGGVSSEVARARVGNWIREYPRLYAGFCDSDGRPPQHTFFYPLEQYDSQDLDELADLCARGFGEVEVHLHHDGDNAASLRERLNEYTQLIARKHNLLARRRGDPHGRAAYAFVHGDWALDNSRPDGRCCGVTNELEVLRQTGCYADFTLPSAPDITQTAKINSIYYACGDPTRPRAHDRGIDVGRGPRPAQSLMLIQGPLMLDWRRRKWGIFPRIENGCLQPSQTPSMERLDAWLRARVQVSNRPDWVFVKLYCHGAPEEGQRILLGEPMMRFHQALAERAIRDANFRYHYVTAREMYNLARAAEDGWTGSVSAARDYELVWPPPPVATAPRQYIDQSPAMA